ncbi:MAG: hypothetical protein ACFFE2_04910 [Candidatus Thorarchaeota archaeon]
MPFEHSPEERLKRYKASLDKMAKEEGRNLKTTKQKMKTSKQKGEKAPNPVKQVPRKVKSPDPQHKPPQVLVSPAKKELRTAGVSIRKSLTDAKVKEIDGRNLVMLKVRLRSIDSSLRDIKKRRDTLEAQLKSKFIDKERYRKEMDALVDEGRTLLVERERVEKEMKKLKQE